MVRKIIDIVKKVIYRLHMFLIYEAPEFSKWFRKLKDRNARTRILDRLVRVEQGNLGDHKPIGDDLFELRFTFGAGYRIYFAQEADQIIILLVGGDKSTQGRDIQKAREIMKGLE